MEIYYCEKTPSLELLKSSFSPVKNVLAIKKPSDFLGKRILKLLLVKYLRFIGFHVKEKKI